MVFKLVIKDVQMYSNFPQMVLVKQLFKQFAKELDEGNMVFLFPEGSITRNGHLGEFKKVLKRF